MTESLDKDIVIDDAITWIETLAANEFEQQREGYLCDGSAHCCLGVANELFHLGSNPLLGFVSNEKSDLPACDVPIPEVGIKPFTQHKLANMNDRGSTFPDIAREMIARPNYYFEPDVAEGIKEHFWRIAA